MTAETPSPLVPKLRFPEFKDGPRWDELPLSSVSDVNPSNDGLPESFIYIDLESVKSGMLVERKEIGRDTAPSRAQRLLRGKDIIYQTVRPYQRNNLLFDIEDGYEYVASTGYAQLRAHGCPEFLYQLLHTDSFINSVLAQCTGSNYPAINSSDLASIHVALPRNPEQQKIANCLGSLDDLIAMEGRKLEALRQHKQGLMQQLFPQEGETRPRLRFPMFEDVWNETNLQEECGSIVSGKDKADPDGEFDLYGSTGVIGKTSHGTYDGRFILVARVGANAGMLTVARGQFGVTDNTLVVFLKDPSKIDFISQYLKSFDLNKLTFGSGQPLITGRQLKALRLYFPSEEEQKKIAGCLSFLDDRLAVQMQRLSALKAHKQGLLQQLFPSMEGNE